MPPKKFATVSFAAKPTAMPATPAAPSRGVISMPHSHSRVPTLPTSTASVQTFENTGAKSNRPPSTLTAATSRFTTVLAPYAQTRTMTDSDGRPNTASSSSGLTSTDDRTDGTCVRRNTPASAAVTTSGARSEVTTMSSYAESVLATYRRATRKIAYSIPTAATTETTRTATVASSAVNPSNS